MQRRSVFYVQSSPYIGDVRTDKFIRTLMKKYHVVIVSPGKVALPSFEKLLNNVSVHRFRIQNNVLSKIVNVKFAINPFLIRFVKKLIKKYLPVAIIVRDIYFFPSIYFANYRHKARLILDMAECLPCEAKEPKRNFYDLIRRNYIYLSLLEKFSVEKADKVFVVVEEQIQRLGNYEKKLVVVSNYVDLRNPDYFKEPPKQLEYPSVVFAGRPNYLRGLEDLIEAAVLSKKQNYKVYFYIVGGSQDNLTMKRLRREIRKKSLEDRVFMTGWVRPAEMYAYMRGATIGLISHKNSLAVNHTIPNKIFEFLLFGKPIIVSDAPPLKNIIEKKEVGVWYKSGDAYQLFDCIKVLLNNSDYYKRISQRAPKIVMNEFNWEHQEHIIFDAIK
ncbi:MAG: glycosyltransferase [Thermosipho sp. (in: Bacteria)]|nr:glycosyltransferase [Thermosipho sp. (in: thermotogales)]